MAEATADPSSAHAASKLRHEWYQSESHVFVSVFIKNLKANDVKCEVHERSLSLNVKLPTGAEAVFDLDPLARSVDPKTYVCKTMSTKVEIKLPKAQPGIKWNSLEGDEESTTATSMQHASERKGPSYPTSSRNKHDWDAVAKAVKEEEEKPADPNNKDPNAGGDRELNALFQKIYSGASDEQRKAMMKSYQESNGTALSTDWGDVQKGKVETKPPDGLIAKNWNGKDAKVEERDSGFLSHLKPKK